MIEQTIQNLIKQHIKQTFDTDFLPNVHISTQANVDYQCDDCFLLAKTLHKSPIQIAEKIVESLNENQTAKDCFEQISCKNGFINFVLSESFLNLQLNYVNSDEKFGVKMPKKPELFFFDYGGPNIAKPLHVGHLRSPIIGESVKRIVAFAGHKTLSDVHYGDFGLQIGEVIYGLKERNIKKEDITLSLLNEIYPNINARIKVDENLNKTCAEITKQLQEGNKEYLEYFKIIRDISGNDIKRIYKYLDVNFDYYYGESDSYNYIPKLTKILNEKNLLISSNGAKVIDISKETDKKELPPLIFQKSNGAYLYGTTDMATVLERVNDFNPDHIVYFADIRQDLHYTQFFRAVDKANIIDENKLEFHGFGTVNGIDGKPYKTREGKSPSLDSLFCEVKDLLLKNKQMDLENESDIDEIVNSVIKFADLQNNYEKDYIFDLEKFSKLEGKTGPYVLYSYCRFNKILKKFEASKNSFEKPSKNKFERDIKLKILNFAPSFSRAFIERKPSIIADYIFDLCLKLNLFYENNRLLSEENKEYLNGWISLIELSLKILKQSLNLLVINTIERM